jgi:membrane-associated phospholipid phosphatase
MDVARALLERLNLRILLYWGLMIGGAWLFVELADEIYEGDGLPFDEAILTWMNTIRDPLLDTVMVALSTVGNVIPMFFIALAGAIFFWRYRRHEGTFFTFSMIGAVLIMTITKYVLARDRPELFPDPALWIETSPSFPSGHATGSFALFLTVMLIIHRKQPRWGPVVVLLAGIFAVGVTFSRLYLQVHYPSDVMAGWALAAAWVLGMNYFFTRDRNVRTILLTLPRDTVQRYRTAAKAEGVSEAEYIEQALNERLERQSAPADPQHHVNA